MKWTSAAFGARLPDDGAAADVRSAGAGEDATDFVAPLQAHVSPAIPIATTDVDRDTLFMRSLSRAIERNEASFELDARACSRRHQPASKNVGPGDPLGKHNDRLLRASVASLDGSHAGCCFETC